jgi:hypothetical protein
MFKKFIVIVFVCFLGWQIYHKYLRPYVIGNLNKEILQEFILVLKLCFFYKIAQG